MTLCNMNATDLIIFSYPPPPFGQCDMTQYHILPKKILPWAKTFGWDQGAQRNNMDVFRPFSVINRSFRLFWAFQSIKTWVWVARNAGCASIWARALFWWNIVFLNKCACNDVLFFEFWSGRRKGDLLTRSHTAYHSIKTMLDIPPPDDDRRMLYIFSYTNVGWWICL